MDIKLLIYGNGSMAKVLYSYIRHSAAVCGFTVDDKCIADNSGTFCGLPLVPFSNVQNIFHPDQCNMIISVGFVEMNDLREKKYFEAKKKRTSRL